MTTSPNSRNLSPRALAIVWKVAMIGRVVGSIIATIITVQPPEKRSNVDPEPPAWCPKWCTCKAPFAKSSANQSATHAAKARIIIEPNNIARSTEGGVEPLYIDIYLNLISYVNC